MGSNKKNNGQPNESKPPKKKINFFRWFKIGLVLVIVGLLLTVGAYLGQFGLFGKGVGLGDGPQPPDKIKNPPELQPSLIFSFYFKNDKIFYHSKQINAQEFLQLLQDAKKKKEIVQLSFVEENTTVGFLNKTENTVKELQLKYRIERIRPEGS